MLISAQEYGITDRIFFGTDFPFARWASRSTGSSAHQ
jgi:hypothetical protein